jgi:extracellular elastinolytic metalloproteinase
VEQYWLPSNDRRHVTLVWNVCFDDLHSDDVWMVRVDAQTGQIAEKNNLTIYEQKQAAEQCSDKVAAPREMNWPVNSFVKEAAENITRKAGREMAPFAPVLASYQIIPYPGESPDVRAADLVVDPWLQFGAGNPATTLGWHSTSFTDYKITRGNNVFAYLGTQPTDLPDATYNWPDTSTLPGARNFFLQVPNYTYQPNDSIHRENKKFAIDNAFYWNNMLHDVTYQYGFTEAAGNFQADNMGRASWANDQVLAQVQDGHGNNNANFTPLQDGISGRMRLYLWFTGGVEFSVEESFGRVTYPARDNLCDAPNKLPQTGPVSGDVVLFNDDAAGTTHYACGAPANNIAGKIALVDLNSILVCGDFALVAKNCQNAGAIGVVVYDIDEGLWGVGGTDTSVHIPLIVIGNAAGMHIIERLTAGETVSVSMSPGYRDAGLDNGVISHEYMHGVTNRLTGGVVGCLNNNEQAGEGWSDYMSLMMTTDWSTTTLGDMAKPRGIANYANSQAPTAKGIRSYPYCTNMSVNPLTYADVVNALEEHYVGEVWCAVLWDMTWSIIQQNGTISPGFLTNSGPGGNIVAMNLVMTALKLQPCYPGFIDARDAILAADSLLYNKQYHCAIWSAFARRGMGFNALQGSSFSSKDQQAGFALPVGVISMKDSVIYSGSSITVTHSITPECQPLVNYTIRDTIPKGFTYVSSSPPGTLVLDSILVSPPMNTTLNHTGTFSVTMTANGPGCAPDTVINDNQDDHTLGGFTINTFPFGAPTWTPAASGGRTGNGWFCPDVDGVTFLDLASQPTAAAAGKNISLFSFWHRYNTEYKYDGGIVEYSLDGTNWFDAAPFIIKNPYNVQMIGHSFAHQKTFSGDNGGFQQTVIDLSSFGTTPLRLRFNFNSDEGYGVDGWYIDDILRVNSCGGKLKSGFFQNSSFNPEAVSVTTIQVLPQSTLPLSLLSFEAATAGPSDILTWKTAAEVNVKEFEVQFSTDGREWTTLSAVAARNQAENEYTYTNLQPVTGANYYRLKMKDIDGQFTYSPVRILRRRSEAELFSLVPNPAEQTAHFYFSRDLDVSALTIYDGTGRAVKQLRLIRGSQQQAVDISRLSPGVYIAEAVGAAGRHVIRFVVK